MIAITAMLEAESIPVEDPENQNKVNEENEKSAKEFAIGDTMRDEGIPEKAIDQYEKAWDHAQNAIKAALENDDDDWALLD